MITATLTSKGQLTVPKEIRDRFQLKSGQRIEFRITGDGQILFKPRTRNAMALHGLLKAKPGQHVTLEQMNDVIADSWAGTWRPKTKVAKGKA